MFVVHNVFGHVTIPRLWKPPWWLRRKRPLKSPGFENDEKFWENQAADGNFMFFPYKHCHKLGTSLFWETLDVWAKTSWPNLESALGCLFDCKVLGILNGINVIDIDIICIDITNVLGKLDNINDGHLNSWYFNNTPLYYYIILSLGRFVGCILYGCPSSFQGMSHFCGFFLEGAIWRISQIATGEKPRLIGFWNQDKGLPLLRRRLEISGPDDVQTLETATWHRLHRC